MNKRGLEARDNWIDARVDELLDDKEFLQETTHEYYRNLGDCGLDKFQAQVALQQACSEHAELMADLEEERINAAREY